MKVYELAKELGVLSKEVLPLLNDGATEKLSHMSVLTDEQIEFVRSEYAMEQEIKEKAEQASKDVVKRDADYRPDEMIPCHSVYEGIRHIIGSHTGMAYRFNGFGDRRNIEYQDLKGAMLEHTPSLFNPDIVIDDKNLINDEHWYELKELYETLYTEQDIKELLSLRNNTKFEEMLRQLPVTARDNVIKIVATQIENGTFEQLSKVRIIDKVCGTRFDLLLV